MQAILIKNISYIFNEYSRFWVAFLPSILKLVAIISSSEKYWQRHCEWFDLIKQNTFWKHWHSICFSIGKLNFQKCNLFFKNLYWAEVAGLRDILYSLDSQNLSHTMGGLQHKGCFLMILWRVLWTYRLM